MPEDKAKKKTTKKKTTKKKVVKKKQANPSRGKVDPRTRAARIKEVHREELRKRFKGNEYIRQLELAATDYDGVRKKLNKKGITRDEKDTLKLIIDVLKAKVDLNLKRLRFVLPELKAISFEDNNGLSITDQFFEAMSQATKNNR